MEELIAQRSLVARYSYKELAGLDLSRNAGRQELKLSLQWSPVAGWPGHLLALLLSYRPVLGYQDTLVENVF